MDQGSLAFGADSAPPAPTGTPAAAAEPAVASRAADVLGDRVQPGSATPARARAGGLRSFASDAEWRADLELDLAERRAYEVRWLLTRTGEQRELHLKNVSEKRSPAAAERLRAALRVAFEWV